jgi:hypothetical protein
MSPNHGADAGATGPLPMLARGRHRSPRKGACFMELASYLAGERWSDHPRCTHPLLAALARGVNDASSDAARPLLAPLIPAVVGLDGDDERWSVEIALLAATAALPIASASRQNALAVALLTCERVLDELEDREPGFVRPQTLEALREVPGSEAWARRFFGQSRVNVGRFTSSAGQEIVRLAVEGIAEACVPDPDRRLRDLLTSAIEECRTWAGFEPLPDEKALDPATWRAVCRPWSLTG